MHITQSIAIAFLVTFYPAILVSSQAPSDTTSLFFPLSVGDAWFFNVDNESYPGYHFNYNTSVKIEKDTLMPNGKIYFQLPPMSTGPDSFPNQYLRKDSSRVYQFNPIDSSEFLRYDLSAQLGDTLIIFQNNPFRGIVFRDTATYKLFGQYNVKELTFYGIIPQNDIVWSSVADSLGFVSQVDGYLSSWSLIGAKVNGKEYGQILSVDDKYYNMPRVFYLYQNYPNPFNPTTTIQFDLQQTENTRLSVYDYLGREVSRLSNAQMTAGHHEVIFNAFNLASGIYFVRLISGSYSSTRKMLLLK
jgi:Secretion system C-terminal sorting domain